MDFKIYAQAVTERFLLAMRRIIAEQRDGCTNQKKFAEKIGMQSSNISRMEKEPGTYNVTLEGAARLVNDFGISAEWLMVGKGRMWDDMPGIASIEDVAKAVAKVDRRLAKIEQAMAPKAKVRK